MIQDQLVEYISSQVKLGVSRDSIKTALVGAGWAAADVDDTMNKVSAPATAQATPAMGSTSAGASPMGAAAKGPEPRAIRVSDLVAGSAPSSMTGPTTATSSPFFKSNTPASGAAVSGAKAQKPIDLTASSGTSGMDMRIKKGGHLMTIVWVVIIVVLLGLAGYLYFQNSSLSSKVASLGGQSTDVTSQISSLNTQVQALTASNTALMAQVDSLTAQNADLLNNLSFIAVPASTGATATSTITVSGTLTGGKSSFALTTAYGVVIYVANAKTASVSAALTPLIGSTTTVQLTGIHADGSQYITVTAVNGSSTTQ